MRYWDTSALVPIVVEEPGSDLVRAWLKEDDRIVTWALTSVETCAAVERRTRQGRISSAVRKAVLSRFDALAAAWDEVTDLLPVRTRARALLARHLLRAADAVQLAAALVAAEGHPESLEVVCLDRALAEAAEREGFRVLTWPA